MPTLLDFITKFLETVAEQELLPPILEITDFLFESYMDNFPPHHFKVTHFVK